MKPTIEITERGMHSLCRVYGVAPTGAVAHLFPADTRLDAYFEMSSAASGMDLIVNPINWTRRAGAQPETLVYPDEILSAPISLAYEVAYDTGTSLRTTASINGIAGGVASVKFFNTVKLTDVLTPTGAVFSAASGIDYHNIGATVPLPGALSLLAPSVLLLTRRGRKNTTPA